MRKEVGIALVALFMATFAGAAEPEGYGEFRWGDPAPAKWQRKHPQEAWVHSVGSRGNSFGAVPLEQVDYEFVGGHLESVVLVFKDRGRFLALKAHLEGAFSGSGEPVAAPPASECLRWRGARTWAYLSDLGATVPGLLFLAGAPQPAPPEAFQRAAQERDLTNRLRLYEHIDAVLGKSLKTIADEIVWADRSLQESQPTSVKCRDYQVDREQDQQLLQRDRRELLSEQDAVVAERARRGQEAEAVRAALTALRGQAGGPGVPEGRPPAPPP